MTIFRMFLIVLVAMPFMACHRPTAPSTEDAKLLNSVPTTVFLVRHSEKESGSDPVLSSVGLERNAALVNLLSEIEFDAVFSTAFKRTEMTAKAICDAQDLELINYDHKDLPGLAQMIKEDYQGQQVLVVGHSNSTPTLCGLLDGTGAHEDFDESDYGNLMMVVVPALGPAKTLKLRF